MFSKKERKKDCKGKRKRQAKIHKEHLQRKQRQKVCKRKFTMKTDRNKERIFAKVKRKKFYKEREKERK